MAQSFSLNWIGLDAFPQRTYIFDIFVESCPEVNHPAYLQKDDSKIMLVLPLVLKVQMTWYSQLLQESNERQLQNK